MEIIIKNGRKRKKEIRYAWPNSQKKKKKMIRNKGFGTFLKII